MTSRGLFWLVLSTAALPLLFEAVSGCGFSAGTIGPTRDLNDNALECGCTCNPGDLMVLAGTDDAEQDGATMILDDDDLDLGEKIVGLRFDGVLLPPGALIQTAYVQFTVRDSDAGTTSVTIHAEASTAAATFTTTDDDLSGRVVGTESVDWSNIDPWTSGDAGPAQQTPDLSLLLQELVNLPGWTRGSAVVLRFEALEGRREGVPFETDPAAVAKLVIVSDSSVSMTLPICASPGVERDSVGAITDAGLAAECEVRAEATLSGLARACTYPSACTCTLVDIPGEWDNSFESGVCNAPCTEMVADGTCTNFDPDAFNECLAANNGDVSACEQHVSATNAPPPGSSSPVCVASGSPLAYQLYGRRSECAVQGTSHIELGEEEPEHDPATAGRVEILGGPCPGADCAVNAYLALIMDPIEFDKFGPNPVFRDLSASGRSVGAAMFTSAAGEAVFAEDTLFGTGNGRRGSDSLAVDATNEAPLDIGIDWAGKACDVVGNLAATVDGEEPDGTCTGDSSVVCTADSPDCDAVGGPCVFEEEDIEPMTVNVALLDGTIVTPPPTAAAGADQSVECTSSAGASFTLSGSASDPDGNVALTSWRAGSRIGPELSPDLSVSQALGVGGTEHYVLRVIDSFAQADEDATQVAVVDTAPPELSLSVSPATLWPPNHKFHLVTASLETSDVCDTSPEIRLVSITSNEPGDGSGDGSTNPDVQGAAIGTDDRQFMLRAERSGNGSGRVYTITYVAEDDSGNETTRQATVSVAHNK
jgi:hypothetical protein